MTKASVAAKKKFGWHPTPLKNTFMLIALLGLLISIYLIYGKSPSFGLAFIIVFAAMLAASLISMTKAPILKETR